MPAFERVIIAVPVTSARLSPARKPLRLTPLKLAGSAMETNFASLFTRTWSVACVMLAVTPAGWTMA